MGWKPAFFSEIDPFPRAVLSHHYPDVPLHDDFTTIGANQYGSIGLLVGGTPCQSFSVAGLRKGLDDDRGNLALEFIRLAQRERPQWVVWENVPGVLSSNGGRDFGAFLGALAEIGYGFAYRVLDAQFFGVAQRRRRVFVVGYLGDWRPAAAVLFERESLSGNSAPSRKARQDTPADFAQGAEVYECHGQDSRVKPLGETCSTVTAKYGTGGGNVPIVTETPLRSVSSTLSAMDNEKLGSDQWVDEGKAIIHRATVGALDTQCGLAQQAHQSLNSGHYVLERETMGTITARMFNALGARDVEEGALLPAVGFTPQSSDMAIMQEKCPTLIKSHEHAVAFAENQQADVYEMNVTNSLSGGGGKPGQGYQAVREGLSVRRLTPTECERLQGFPDGFTQIPYRNKPADKCPDGPRYKALGNSMAVPVMRWIGERINEVNKL
tara:strand:- start:175 stop:1488 length:1314 start_codon:yes stop_codon:yes gene_type:complete